MITARSLPVIADQTMFGTVQTGHSEAETGMNLQQTNIRLYENHIYV